MIWIIRNGEEKPKKDFVSKFKTENFEIGSFDVYQEEALELIKNNYRVNEEKAKEYLNEMPTPYRAAVINNDGEYVGYIGVEDIDYNNQKAAIILNTKDFMTKKDCDEIITEYKDWIENYINLTGIYEIMYLNKETLRQVSNVVKERKKSRYNYKYIREQVDIKELEKFKETVEYKELTYPFYLVMHKKVVGVIGLNTITWSNRRANLNVIFDRKTLEGNESIVGKAIDEYLDFLLDHTCIVNVSLEVSGRDKLLQDILESTRMKFYAAIPFACADGFGYLTSKFLYQNFDCIENTAKKVNMIVPIINFDRDKRELSSSLIVDYEYSLVSLREPDFSRFRTEEIVNAHIKALQNRKKFSIPLGEDKYMIQKGNDKYGMRKAVKNFTYFLVDRKGKYAGYVNILRTNACDRHAEIEIGIRPDLQGKGVGTKVLKTFYDELFKVGYASVTSCVFSFNERSEKLHKNMATLNGIRKFAYYSDGKLWNMSYYTKVNPIAEKIYMDF